MAYGNKYKVEFAGGDGFLYRIHIKQWNWTGGVTDLTPSESSFVVKGGEQGTDELQDALWIEEAELKVLGMTGLLDDIFDAPDDEYQLVAERSTDQGQGYELHWAGYVLTDFYEDDYYDEEVIRLKAIDGLGLLKHRAHDTPGTAFFTIIQDILAGLNTGLEYSFTDEWRPYLENQFPSDLLPLEQLHTLDENWESGDGTTDSQLEILKQLLGRFGLQLRQSDGRWHVLQPSSLASTGLNPAGQAKVWRYDAAGTSQGAAAVEDHVVDAAPIEVETEVPRSFTQRVEQVASTHSFGALQELAQNGGFEAALDSAAGWNVLQASEVQRKHYDNISNSPAATQEDSYALEIQSYDSLSARWQVEQSGIYVANNRRNELALHFNAHEPYLDNQWGQRFDVQVQIGGFCLTHKFANLRSSALQAEDGIIKIESVAGTDTGRALVPAGATLYVVKAAGSGPPELNGETKPLAQITLSEPLKVGDTTAHGKISEDIDVDQFIEGHLLYYTWEAASTFTHPMPFHVGSAGEETSFFHQRSFVSKLTTPAGVAVEGTMALRFAMRPYSHGGASEPVPGKFGFIDDVEAAIKHNGEEVDSATSVASIGDRQALSSNFRIGDGPLRGSATRIRAYDSVAGAYDELTGGWKFGTYGSTDQSTGKSIDELLAEKTLRARRRSLETLALGFILRGGQDILPHHVLKVRAPAGGHKLYTIEYYERDAASGEVYVELVELYEGPGDDITYAFAQSSGTASGQGAGGATVVAKETGEFDGTVDWGQVVGKPTLVNSFEGRTDDITLQASDIVGALGYDPASRFADASGDTFTGDTWFQAKFGVDGGSYFADEGGDLALFNSAGNRGTLIVNEVILYSGGTTSRLEGEVVTIADNLLRLNTDATQPAADGGHFIYRGPNDVGKGSIYSEAQGRWGEVDITYNANGNEQIDSASFSPFAVSDGVMKPHFGSIRYSNTERPASEEQAVIDSMDTVMYYDRSYAPETDGDGVGPTFFFYHESFGGGWAHLWNSSYMGHGTGLDADLLDGEEGTWYAAYPAMRRSRAPGPTSRRSRSRRRPLLQAMRLQQEEASQARAGSASTSRAGVT